jgi:hypothetical protein
MITTFTKEGVLHIKPETELEAYALNKWWEENAKLYVSREIIEIESRAMMIHDIKQDVY